MFSEDGSVSREVLQQYLTPGTVDDFLGVGMEMGENSCDTAVEEDAGLFAIPQELLVNMPIVDVPPNTKIIHLGHSAQSKPTEGGSEHVR